METAGVFFLMNLTSYFYANNMTENVWLQKLSSGGNTLGVFPLLSLYGCRSTNKHGEA